MRAVIQRVTKASVTVNEEVVGAISEGVVTFLGIGTHDKNSDIDWMAEKIVNLRIFEDNQGKMNLSLRDIGGEMLIISQFTLYGDCRKGRRPGFSGAAPPDLAEPMYKQFINNVEQLGIQTASGKFQAEMEVDLTNNGPVTMLLDSNKTF